MAPMLWSPRLRLRSLTGGFRVLSGPSEPIALRSRGLSCGRLDQLSDAHQIADRGGEHAIITAYNDLRRGERQQVRW